MLEITRPGDCMPVLKEGRGGGGEEGASQTPYRVHGGSDYLP